MDSFLIKDLSYYVDKNDIGMYVSYGRHRNLRFCKRKVNSCQ